jgi:flagellin-like protein
VNKKSSRFQVFTNRRALSPIFATMILAAIVISLGSVAYYYVNNVTTTTTNQLKDNLVDSQQTISERLSFENVFYASSSLKIYLINSGVANSVQINSVFIYDENHKIVGTPYSNSPPISPLYQIDGLPQTPIPGNQLNVGQEGYFTINLTGSLENNKIYEIHLITKGESSFDYKFML